MAHRVWVTVSVSGVAALPNSTLTRLRWDASGCRATSSRKAVVRSAGYRVGENRASVATAPRYRSSGASHTR